MSATKQTATAATRTGRPEARRDDRRPDYHETLRTLSEASVHQHFDAFLDIPWDDPAYAVDPRDERWILPQEDVLGRHPWYRSLPKERQIEVGLYRQANINKVGLQFEQVLIGGIMQYAFRVPNGNPEFRYATHEAAEECHHTQMFQEFVNRSGVDVPGGSRLFRMTAPFMPLAAAWVPAAFFVGVLAGEEPIDHLQKSILRGDAHSHPLLRRIMQIHIAEEARHIGFAHRFLQHHVPQLGRVRNGDPEFRYSTHEAAEECHHTQMFQEFVNRSGVDAPGGSRLFRMTAPFMPLAAAWVPAAFFVGVLAGEEPIDHLQKSVLRAGAQAHPLLRRIMQIHIAEEARHIGFAHRFLQHHVPRLGRVRRAVLSVLFPLIMRWLCDVIMVPGSEARRGMGIPRAVAREVWWRDPESRKVLRDFFADVRMLAESLDLMNPVSRRVWRMCRIDGRPARFRSEPASAAS